MGSPIRILDFEHVYEVQNYFLNYNYQWMDLSSIWNTNRYCEIESLRTIENRLEKSKKSDITFMGSGNYHYITYLLMSKIREPFTLILFDHHTDMVKPIYNSVISCGSWVLNAISNLPMLEKVIIVGVREDLAETIPLSLNKKVKVLTEDNILGNSNIKRDIIPQTTTSNVYISVDKDVLSESDVIVNWDQGNMRLRQLIDILQYIESHKKICGIDICGEYVFTPVELFYQETKEAIQMNNRANGLILRSIMG